MTAGWRYGPLALAAVLAALVAAAGLPFGAVLPLGGLMLGLLPVLALLALVHRAVVRHLPPARTPARRALSPRHRASDAEREVAVAWLREAATEGRLSHEELEERAAAAYSARTYADLERVLHDLPIERVR